ncbi:hypothetical protein AB0L14_33400 [Streptomyces sp. NPDC052727]|uniref:hypothetical protein n=1 Tax=Streptomyces sp. NPDC052727 TaxID=3154854 RepID=UPI00342B6E7A
MHLTRRRPGTQRGPAPGAHTAWHRPRPGQVLHAPESEGLVPAAFMTRLAVVEAAADGTTTERHAHLTGHPA